MEAGQAMGACGDAPSGRWEPSGDWVLVLSAWQGGAPGPAELDRGTSALSHALSTRCWNNHFFCKSAESPFILSREC